MKKYEKILILKDAYNGFERYYLDKLNDICDAYYYYYNHSGVLRKIWTKYKLPFERIWYGKWKNNLDKYDLIIIFDCIKSPKIIQYVNSRSKSRIIYWHWNTINDNDKKIMKKTMDICENWTFDPSDADIYNMRTNSQFFFYPNHTGNTESEINNNCVFFVGADKGRKEKLHTIAKELKMRGILPDFYVIGNSETNTLENYIHFQSEYMDYYNVISKIYSSTAILELVQNGQNGLTARTLEALFFRKKLITDNGDIVNYPFYRHENIFIWGKDDTDNLLTFIQSPYVKIDDSTLYPYSAEGWLSNFGIV